ncbi:hypothetical protein D4R89_04735 [bacterium]|nr:MAG: hypothetical protein D4R89_04735 [bacterium]
MNRKTRKQPRKSQECSSVEGRDRESDEAAVGRTDGPENGRRLPGGGMKKRRIGIFLYAAFASESA